MKTEFCLVNEWVGFGLEGEFRDIHGNKRTICRQAGPKLEASSVFESGDGFRTGGLKRLPGRGGSA